MAMNPPPLLPPDITPRTPGWWDRHWKWAIPVLTLAGLSILVMLLLWLISLFYSGMRNNDACRIAMQQARADRRVIAALGEPIEEDGWMNGNISFNKSANISVPIAGPRAGATLFLEAYTELGVWKFSALAVTVKGSDTPIDLLPGLPERRRMAAEGTEHAREENQSDAR